VIPLPGSKGTEALAVLIRREDHADLNVVVERVNNSLAEFQRIRHWVIWPESDFPRTTGTRKVMKGQVAAALENTVAPLSLPVLSRIAGTTHLDKSAKLAEDLKLDSLGRVELLSALEDQYQIELDEAAVTEATTIADIEEIISRGKSEAVAYPYPRWAMRWPITWIRFLVYHFFVLPITLFMCRVRVLGAERLAQVRGPALLISNHVTDVDAGLILSALPLRWRVRVAIAMQGELLREWRYPTGTLPWYLRWKSKVAYALGAALFNVFPIPRQSGFRQSFAYAGEAVDGGWSVLIFPEGEETKDGEIQPFRAGIGLLASELNVPVIPIKLDGLFELKQKRELFPRPGTVSVTFGEPIRISREQTAEDIRRELERRVREL
jgi:long-chain acyl-CoA synthetase